LEHLEEMAKILNHPRVYSFLHVPIQAGSDAVLRAMRREYTQAEFCQVVDYLKALVSRMNIATDVICGFPTESDMDFEDTLDVVRKYQFASLHISQVCASHLYRGSIWFKDISLSSVSLNSALT
jgi:threonylcarbamoyladenosine tRNA methylthiotransferase CDKAL1